jgi:hypothetical protein
MRAAPQFLEVLLKSKGRLAMELLSLDGGERYRTLAALIHIGEEEHEEFLLTGFFPEDRRD